VFYVCMSAYDGVCPNCEEKVVLDALERMDGEHHVWACPDCEYIINVT